MLNTPVLGSRQRPHRRHIEVSTVSQYDAQILPMERERPASQTHRCSAVGISTICLLITYHPILHGAVLDVCRFSVMKWCLDSKTRMKLLTQRTCIFYKHANDQNSNKLPKIRTGWTEKSGNRRLNLDGTFSNVFWKHKDRQSSVRRPR